MHYADAEPKILLACSEFNFSVWKDNPFVGRLITPVLQASELHRYTGIDNFAYTDWDKDRFVRMLKRYQDVSNQVRWVCCPDVVGDWKTTNIKFEGWACLLNEFRYKCAYVCQDGQPLDRIPWNDISCIFIGGTDDYKLHWDAIVTCRRAKDKGKLVHIGRVNSITRIKRFIDIVDSFDGMTFSRYNKTHLAPVLEYLERRLEKKNAVPTF